jgi:hypothetical protein
MLCWNKVEENDHIAIRTFNDVRVNIAVLEKPFVNAGYVAKGNTFSNLKNCTLSMIACY